MEDKIKTFNVTAAIDAQLKLQRENNYPEFAPSSGICWNCHRQIYAQINRGTYKTGISVEKASTELITGCPHCSHSYCE